MTLRETIRNLEHQIFSDYQHNLSSIGGNGNGRGPGRVFIASGKTMSPTIEYAKWLRDRHNYALQGYSPESITTEVSRLLREEGFRLIRPHTKDFSRTEDPPREDDRVPERPITPIQHTFTIDNPDGDGVIEITVASVTEPRLVSAKRVIERTYEATRSYHKSLTIHN